MAILNKNDKTAVERYEQFIRQSPYGHFMQSVNWAKVKDNWESDYVYLENEANEIVAAMSLISVKNDGEHAFVYCPRGPVCDWSDLTVVNRLVEEAKPILTEKKAFLLRMDPEVKYSDDLLQAYKQLDLQNCMIYSRGHQKKAFSNPRLHMIANISMGTHESYLDTVRSKIKNKIRKPYKSGITTTRITFNDEQFEDALNTFYALTEIMAKRQGISYRPKNYFRRLFESFDDVTLYLTGDEEEVLAASIVLSYNKKAFYIYAASSNNKRSLNPNYQMNNEAIKDAIEKGYLEYDMGGVFEIDALDGLYEFKKGFCSEEGLFEMLAQFDFVFDQTLYQQFMR